MDSKELEKKQIELGEKLAKIERDIEIMKNAIKKHEHNSRNIWMPMDVL